jgi:IS30 family transposase
MARGEQNGAAVLTEELVREIRRRHASGVSAYRMAREYGVAKGTVQFVIQRVTWKHVQGL